VQSLLLFLSAFLGGLFLGLLFFLLGGIVLSLLREGAQQPKEFGFAAIFLTAIFGPAFIYVGYIVFSNEGVVLGACLSFAYLVHRARSPEQDQKGESRKP
jgi:NhaP-type Na+/H+ or K+/H+ antiporter